MQYVSSYQSPLEPVTLAGDEAGLAGLWFDGQKYFGSTLAPERTEGDLPLFRETRLWLDRFFAGQDPGPRPPLALRGTPFQLAVWALLLEIPRGGTVTYGQLAARLAAAGRRASAQAVGGAVGRNPVSILVPCHRVVGANGSLTGYAGGVGKKLRLLSLEGASVSGLSAPRGGAAR